MTGAARVVRAITFLAAICTLQVSADTPSPTNSTWNYDNGGDDWATLYPTTCGKQTTVQAPITIRNYAYDSHYLPYVWSENAFSFLPYLKQGLASFAGPDQWVY